MRRRSTRLAGTVLLAALLGAAAPSTPARAQADDGLDLTVSDASLRAVLELIAGYGDKSFVIGDEVDGRVSLRLQGVTWRQALEAVVRAAGDGTLALEEDEASIRIVGRAAGAAPPVAGGGTGPSVPLQTKAFALRWASPPEGTDPEQLELLRTVRAVLRAGGGEERGESATYDGATNSLLVRAIPARIAEVEGLLAQLDVEPAQIELIVRFIGASGEAVEAIAKRLGTDEVPSVLSAEQLEAALGLIARNDEARIIATNVVSLLDDRAADLRWGGAAAASGEKAGGAARRWTRLRLPVTCHVVEGEDRIVLTARPSVDDVEADQTLACDAVLADGGTAVIAGYFVEREETDEGERIRVVGSVSELFTGRYEVADRERLLIFVTASVVSKGD